jgi:two-component system NtrC family sensor kinase
MSDRTEDLLARGPREHGIGLRAQIMVALGVGFALSVALLGMAAARLGGRALDADRQRSAEASARVVLAAGALEPAEEARALDALAGAGGVLAVELSGRVGPRVRGARSGAATLEVREGDRVVRLWLDTETSARRSLSGLVFLYVGITAAAILLITYVLLGRAIVRPVEELTRASERIAQGGEARVPVRGAAEVARLAVAFNVMQSQLGREKAALHDRLAELERTTAELAAAQRSLVMSEKMASVGRLAAGVAHEIGNPLSAILGLVELVQSGGLSPEDEREFLRRVAKETERIHHIIRDLLDFARTEPTAEASASCDLVEVVEDAVRLVGPQKDLRQVTIERRVPEECPRVRGSAARLAQVVLNLLLNAADAIEGEGVIRLEVALEDEGVALRVDDTGPGIAPEVREHLFEPFVSTKPTGQGTGLGLAVCHTIVEQLGGSIEAGDAPDGGARFTVWLPRA